MSAAGHDSKNMLYSLAIAIILAAVIFEFWDRGAIVIGFDRGTPTADIFNQAPSDYYKVSKVVDGDTIDVDINGEKQRVRLLGINSPETKDPRRPVECFGKEASKYLEEIIGSHKVTLEADATQSTYDAYGRMLAYVFRDDGLLLNRMMISNGYAYEYTYSTPYKYQTSFKEEQKFAKQNNRGLWSAETCNGLKTPVAPPPEN